ncbi:MAG: hypothetical protein IKQ51_11215 [Bacteroidaceae bacterium]|nr:hypothetical protein [Bacteroidaceae bacterium]
MSTQQLDLFNDYALDVQNQQAENSLKGFFEATGIRNSSSLVLGEDNPICQKEMYVPDIPGKNTGVFYQIIGNMGAYANKEYLDDTNIILLPDETLRKLEQGVKDEVIQEIEKYYRKSSVRFQNIRFTCESDFLCWVKSRLATAPDECTLHLLEIFEKS